jgi:DNA-binding protein YbaB
LSNDALRDGVTDVLGRLRDQLADIAAVQKKQAALKLSAQAADGTVEVTVNARGQLVNTVIDESYLDDHDFDELANFITQAAQTAATEAAHRVAEMMGPITQRQRSFPSFSDIVDGLPDVADLIPPGLDTFSAPPQPQDGHTNPLGAIHDFDGDSGVEFPTVRR